jgi:deoxycytidylate deaminase
MEETLLASLDMNRTELVLGLVGAMGTELERVATFLEEGLHRFRYQTRLIRLTRLFDALELASLGLEVKSAPEYERIRTRIQAGNGLRQRSGRNDIFALYAAQQISASRRLPENGGGQPITPSWGTAHVLHSLKHPEEVRTLRRLYGPGFFLLGIYSPETLRLRNLMDRHLVSEERARELIRRDASEREGHGQHARDTFELSDVFIPMTGNEEETKRHLQRFLELVFGAPSIPPTQQEHAMFMAFAAALRSGSLARQVGAVITTPSGDILANGANDASQHGGGQYWPGVHDQRDSARGVDYNDVLKRRMVVEVMRRVKEQYEAQSELGSDDDLYDQGRALFAETGLLDLTEFSREVHAEMAALMACARSGAMASGAHLYATTFPCHNCAKHIVAAGIERVYFVEPYPKSRALQLHDDSITLMDGQEVRGRVAFVPFVGVGPRRFFDLFSMKLSSGRPLERKEAAGRSVQWAAQNSAPRIPLVHYGYMQREQLAIDELRQVVEALIQHGGRT